MKTPLSEEQLYDAFQRAGLGTEDHYSSWTALWAIRSNIWTGKKMQKDARKGLGTIAKLAIEEAAPQLFRHLAEALEAMLEGERRPEYALRADVFFAVEELNSSGVKFTRDDLLTWLNKELDAAITREELGDVLELMGLSELLPRKR